MAVNPKSLANLKSIKKGDLTPEELKKRQSNGGKRTAEIKRAQKDARETAKYILSLAAKGKVAENLEQLGIPNTERNNMVALQARLFTMAMSGDLEAYKQLMTIAGYDSVENRKERESLASDRRRDLELDAKMNALGNNPDAKVSMSFGDEGGNGGVMIYLPEIDKEENCEVDEPDELDEPVIPEDKDEK